MFFVQCKKKVDAYMVTAQFTFTNSGTKFVTSDISVNPKDSVYFQFTATSTSTMAKIIVSKNATNLDTLLIPSGSGNTFSATKKYITDSVPGTYSYIFSAYDAGNIRLGTATIVVTINADFNYFTLRTLFVPDTTSKTNPTYFSTTTGKTYSYSMGSVNAPLIDFGYYYDTTTANKSTIYALTANPVSFYDVSTWMNNATIFKKISSSTPFTTLTSAGAIRSFGITNLASGTSSKVAALGSLTGNNLIAFRTAAGKYGAILITLISASSPASSSYVNIEVKVAL